MTEEKKKITKNDIRPIYHEFMGYLSQTPLRKDLVILSENIVNMHNKTIEELENLTGENFKKFIVELQDSSKYGRFAQTSDFRFVLGGLIMRIYGRYFPDEIQPFSGQPGIVVNTSQHQAVVQHVSSEFITRIEGKLATEQDPDKKGFLEKAKDVVSTASSATDLFGKLALKAKEFGLGLDDISNLFS